jgi:hypothetical protein
MSWTLPALLGAYHGLNPAMGWLFAVALGLQERRTAAVLRALPAIALGHAASVAGAVLLFTGAALVIRADVIRVGSAVGLFAFAGYLLMRRKRHRGGIGMRVGFRELTLWSFLMSSAHGAGLMLLPVLVRGAAPMHEHASHTMYANNIGILGIHTLAMFSAMTAAALVVYQFVGVDFLRRAWLNLDAVWVAALVVSGFVTLI